MSTQTPLFPDVNNNGLVDEFGNGGAANAHATYFPVPASLQQQPQSAWYIAQYVQPVYINPANYSQDDPSTYDPLYGNALYSWTESGTNASIAIYMQPQSQGGGYVYQLTGANGVNEADMFLSTPPSLNKANDTLNHPVTISLDAKITQALFQDSLANANQYGAVASTVDIGLVVNYDGAGGLPKFSGYSQIIPMTTYLQNAGTADAQYKVFYTTAPFPTDATAATQFTYQTLLPGDPYLAMLQSDAGAQPDTLTYNVNNYVYAAIYDAFKNYPAAEQADLLNMANWSIGGLYIGPATNNQEGASGVAGNVISGVQLSNINITTDLSATYDPNDPVGPVAKGDVNPQITFYDQSKGIGGQVDGSAYTNQAGLQAKYIYNGIDNLTLTAPAGANWMFGGGSGMTLLSATSGDNSFVASTGSSFMLGGNGNDSFSIPDDNITGNGTWDSIGDFHAGDTIVAAGLAGSGWTYSWLADAGAAGSTGLTIFAQSTASPGLSELITLASLNSSDLASMALASGTGADAGSLVITENAQPELQFYDFTTGQAGTDAGAADPDVANIGASFIYTGSDTMSFIAPAGTNWLFGGGSGQTALMATSGDNIFVASTGSSFMTGGSGNDTFEIPDASLTGIGTWDTIQNFHTGDTVSLAGLAGPDWSYSWLTDQGDAGNTGLTLLAQNTASPGLSELVTFSGLQQSDLANLGIIHGGTGTLVITA